MLYNLYSTRISGVQSERVSDCISLHKFHYWAMHRWQHGIPLAFTLTLTFSLTYTYSCASLIFFLIISRLLSTRKVFSVQQNWEFCTINCVESTMSSKILTTIASCVMSKLNLILDYKSRIKNFLTNICFFHT